MRVRAPGPATAGDSDRRFADVGPVRRFGRSRAGACRVIALAVLVGVWAGVWAVLFVLLLTLAGRVQERR